MIKRELAEEIIHLASKMPVTAILGPRQSGKTTLAKMAFSSYRYISLEEPFMKESVNKDPRQFLSDISHEKGVIIDEFQNAPSLLSYIQTYVDTHKKNGFFILTGSQNYLMNEKISQSLAGRVALFTLLPLSISELKTSKLLPENLNTWLLKGGYPRTYNENLRPKDWMPDYIQTYVERDVRSLKNVLDLRSFQMFMGHCAGRIGQLVNLTALSSVCGISTKTVDAWLSILEACYIIFRMYPHQKNFSRQLTKHPKIYFYDTGLVCSLLNITSEEYLKEHYLRGGLFENMVISELAKTFFNKKQRPALFFWRDHQGNEVDCIIEQGLHLTPVEIKSSMTMNDSFFSGLNYWNKLAEADPQDGYVVCAGDESWTRSQGKVISWKNIDQILHGP